MQNSVRSLWVRTLTLWIAIFTASRLIVRALPGDPIELLLNETATALSAEALKAQLNLNDPTLLSIFKDLVHFLIGDWGTSILTQAQVRPQVIAAVAHSLTLAVITLLWSAPFALGLGVWSAGFPRRSLVPKLVHGVGRSLAAMPGAWLGPIAFLAFTIERDWFATDNSPWLPSLVLAVGWCGFWSRILDERVRESLLVGAAPGARARGVPEWSVRLRYGLAPVSASLLAYLGTQIGALLGGSFLVEVLFRWPGLGSLLVDSVLKRDYPVIEAALFCGATLALIGSALGQTTALVLINRAHGRTR